MPNVRVSYSQYSMYLGCPKQFKLRYIDKIKEPDTGIYSIFGTAIHRVIQENLTTYYRQTIADAENDDIYAKFKTYLRQEFLNEKQKLAEQNADIYKFVAKKDLVEIADDGINILTFYQKNLRKYFTKKGHKLFGIELELNEEINSMVNYVGFIDLIIHDEVNDMYYIYDIKTSTRRWDESKYTPEKKAQVLLYKKYFSTRYNIPMSKIECKFFILKRKIYTGGDYPEKHIQELIPAQSERTVNKAFKEFTDWVDTVWDKNTGIPINKGEHLLPKPDKWTCKYCPYRKTIHCENWV